MTNISENNITTPLNIHYIQGYEECSDLNVLYSKNDKTFLYKFNIGSELFEISLQETQNGIYDISFISTKYGFADFEGLNMNILGNILKKILNTLKINKNIHTIEFNHVSDFFTVEQVKLARKYLRENHNHSELGRSFTSEEMQNFIGLVRRDLSNQKKVESEYLDVYKDLTENLLEKESVARIKRFDVFKLLLSRIFKNQEIKIEYNDTDIRLHLNI